MLLAISCLFLLSFKNLFIVRPCNDYGYGQKKGTGVPMKTVRHVEISLDEEVLTPAGLEVQAVPHNFSSDDTIVIIFRLLQALDDILTREEMNDLAAALAKEMSARQSSLGTEAADRGRLKLFEV